LPALSAEQQTWLTLTVYYDKDSTIATLGKALDSLQTRFFMVHRTSRRFDKFDSEKFLLEYLLLAKDKVQISFEYLQLCPDTCIAKLQRPEFF